jgi:hypothetical protein
MKQKYLMERYFYEKDKEFHGLKVEKMMIEYFITRFFNPLRYVPYLREEKEKVQRFMSCLSQSFKDKVKFLNPKAMDEVIRHANLCYTQFKQRYENTKKWKNNNTNNQLDPRKKNFNHAHHPSQSALVRKNRFSGKQQSVSV